MTSIDPVLEMADVEVRYGDALALSKLSLSVQRGSVLAVLGANGAGKSTVARAASGLVPVRSGRIVFDGKEITRKRPDQIRRAGLLHLPEGRGVFTGLSVEDNLRMASATIPRGDRKRAVERGYELFEVLAKRRRQTAGTLSGGEQQMLSLARMLILDPVSSSRTKCRSALAPLMVDAVFAGLVRAREAGITILLIEQFVHRALAFADDCIVIARGQAVWRGSASDAMDEVPRRYLGDGTAA